MTPFCGFETSPGQLKQEGQDHCLFQVKAVPRERARALSASISKPGSLLVDKKSGTNSECATPSGTFKMGNN